MSVKQARRGRALANRKDCDRLWHQRKKLERKVLVVALRSSPGFHWFVFRRRSRELPARMCATPLGNSENSWQHKCTALPPRSSWERTPEMVERSTWHEMFATHLETVNESWNGEGTEASMKPTVFPCRGYCLRHSEETGKNLV
jgi:hypothetical protein